MVHNVGGVGGTPDPNHIKHKTRRGQIAGNSQFQGNSSQLIQQGDYYFPGRPLANGFNWNKFKSDFNPGGTVNKTVHNHQSLSMSGDSPGVTVVPAETLGNYSDINQEISSFSELGQIAKTHGGDSDITLTGQSVKGNVVQIADANSGDIDLDASSNLGWARQDAFTSSGDIVMNATAERGAEMSAYAVDGDVNQTSTWGNNLQELHSEASGHKAVQTAGSGNDFQSMEIAANNVRSSQSTGAGNDVAVYEITGHNNEHLMQLGNGRDKGVAAFSTDSSYNKVTMLGGEVKTHNADRAPDEYVVVLNGRNQRVAVNPSLSNPVHQNDTLSINAHHPERFQKIPPNSKEYAYTIYDPSTNSYIDVGHSVGEVKLFSTDQ